MAINMTCLLGRVSRDPDIKYTQDQKCVARFGLALDRGKKNGESLGADFPNIVAFGKTAEIIERYVTKGNQIAIVGHIHTDSYEKDGRKIYTTDIVADRVELLAKNDKGEQKLPTGFEALSGEDIPF